MTRPSVVSAAEYRALPTEAQMTEAIAELVAWRGGRCFHLRDSRQAPELIDLPDLIVVVPGLACLVELKSQDRAVMPGQRRVAELLATVERFWGGVVRPEPRPGELAYDELLRLLANTRSL